MEVDVNWELMEMEMEELEDSSVGKAFETRA